MADGKPGRPAKEPKQRMGANKFWLPRPQVEWLDRQVVKLANERPGSVVTRGEALRNVIALAMRADDDADDDRLLEGIE